MGKKTGTSEEIRRYELLNTRVCDLPLKIEGVLRECILELFRELKRRKIRFRPRFYLGTELDDGWGCVDGTVCIEIPFYMANAELMRIHRDYHGEVETGEEIMKILRHETGHAIDYAYKLHRSKEWKDIFGNFDKRYTKTYRAKPWSKKHVRHLDLFYAQKHPDDDWAESFAVWLTPGLNWRRKYRGWDAIEKLIYVDIAMKQIRGKPPVSRRIAYDMPAKREKRTLAEMYDIEPVTALSEDEMEEYIEDLRQIFDIGRKRRDYHVGAHEFLMRYREAIVEGVCRWIMYSNRNSVRKIIRRWERVCRHYGFALRKSEEAEKLVEVTALLTWYILNEIYGLE